MQENKTKTPTDWGSVRILVSWDRVTRIGTGSFQVYSRTPPVLPLYWAKVEFLNLNYPLDNLGDARNAGRESISDEKDFVLPEGQKSHLVRGD